MDKLNKCVWLLLMLALVGCSSNMKTAFHDNFMDYTVGQSAEPIVLPPGVQLPAKDSYYVIPEIAGSSENSKVTLYPPGSRLMSDNSHK